MSDPRTQTENNFLVLKVWRSKRFRSISVSKLIPSTWSYVIVTILKKTDNEVVLKLEPVRKPEEVYQEKGR